MPASQRHPPASTSTGDRPRFGRVPVWYEETPPAGAAAIALVLVLAGFLLAFCMRAKRPPVAVATVSMQPVASDVHGLQGGSPGRDRRRSDVDAEHELPRDDASDDERKRSDTTMPTHQPAELVKLKSLVAGADSGNTATLLEQTAKELSDIDELVRSARGRAAASDAGQGGAGGDDFGDEPSARFFGLGAEGAESVVYVIDCSGSMHKPPDKLERAKRELVRSIRALRPDQRFFVIFFRDAALPMPANDLVAATPDNKRHAFEWIATVAGHGGTNPAPALHRALELRPESVYVLSDGQFNPAIVTEISRANRGMRRATIYTVGFGDRTGERQLTQLAKDSGGAYRFIEPVAAKK